MISANDPRVIAACARARQVMRTRLSESGHSTEQIERWIANDFQMIENAIISWFERDGATLQ